MNLYVDAVESGETLLMVETPDERVPEVVDALQAAHGIEVSSLRVA